MILRDLLDLYKYLEVYIDKHRGVLPGSAKESRHTLRQDCETTSLDATYDSTKFYEAWRTVIQRYGYTFWKYFRSAFARDAGLRIDHFLLGPSLRERLQTCGADKFARAWEHTSDHAPVWIELNDD